MSIDKALAMLSDRIRSHSSAMATEEAVKTAIVLPFFHALGYDVFDPNEVVPEFTADAVGKKGEKVDYAIKLDGEIRILVECKPITTNLDKVHLAQLFRYFTVTSAKFAVLTNGRTFHFHTDLEEPNKLDTRPFLTFDLAEIQPHLLVELRKFEKSGFDVGGILATAERLKYTSALKSEISKVIEDPPEEFVRMVSAGLYDGRFTSAIRDQFTGLVKAAFREVIRDSVTTRLSTALAATVQAHEEPVVVDPEEEIITTEEEREGYMICKAIAREVIKPSRVVMRDARSYCAILVDNNNRKPLARLHFNRAVKYIGLFDGDKEERVLVESLDHIYDYSDRIRATAARYVDEHP
ncbi:type I restriction endonuclease [Haematobacter genomosp. 1]|uniref:Restriction endonuclease n=1 Tax=Haematobacter genomosp. 1 TaxID=366618 RepID=A0A212A6J9_9RHOB|nr:type I restriction endonuclease [Haematobacter genomosp. 1]OWJ74609.1 restriction endonuclease [Haematobacter genomosp. 1]